MKIEFYQKQGVPLLPAYMEKLRKKAPTSKKARTFLNELEWFLEKAEEDGLSYFDRTAKHMIHIPHVRKIRLGKLRLFYTIWQRDTMVVFHCFEKHTQKTPESEKKLIRKEYEDFLAQKNAGGQD